MWNIMVSETYRLLCSKYVPLALFPCGITIFYSIEPLQWKYQYKLVCHHFDMSHFSYAWKMRYLLNLVLEKFRISLVLLNFLHCNFRLWFKTPQAFDSYPCHASEMTRNTLNHCLKFTLCSIFCHICYGKISEKNFNTFIKV